MKNIPLAVIVDNQNPLGKFYLSYLSKEGYVPKEVILLNYKPKFIIKIKIILREIIRKFSIKMNYVNDTIGIEELVNSHFDIKVPDEFDYSKYTKKLTKVSVGHKKINDKNLYNYIKSSDVRYFLFSGGGIANKKLLNLSEKKFIHTHPGIVPNIRGADCLFWSLLLRGCPGYSCFFMSPEIDEGDIIHQEEYLADEIFNSLVLTDYRNEEIYRGILNSLDLHYRAMCMLPALDKVLTSESTGEKLQTIKQNSNDGRMYFFMHKEVKSYVINKYFNGSNKG